MEELEQFNWSQGFEEDLLKELLYDESQFVLMPQEITSDSFDKNSLNHLISSLYSGPTITDIETALFATSYTDNNPEFSSLARISEMERGVGRVDNKYVLKIKSNGNAMADDGYKWRKYGQKSIKNSSNPRSYYKCTNPRCGAKKQVERSNDDPDTLVITYEGLHLHYMYPYFVLGNSENPNPPTKKFRRFNFELGVDQSLERPSKDIDEGIRHVSIDEPSNMLTNHEAELSEVAISSQGLLEDMVPLFIRNPMIYTTASSKSCSSSSSHPSPPSSPSFSWSPRY